MREWSLGLSEVAFALPLGTAAVPPDLRAWRGEVASPGATGLNKAPFVTLKAGREARPGRLDHQEPCSGGPVHAWDLERILRG
jgi:hypothetical protein